MYFMHKIRFAKSRSKLSKTDIALSHTFTFSRFFGEKRCARYELLRGHFGSSRMAFTLIELLIVVAIILLMAAAAIPAYQSYGAKSELSLKADEIKALIDRAEAYSQNPAQGQNCAQVFLVAPDNIKIQFGSFTASNPGANGCTIDSTQSVISSKDMIDISTSYMNYSLEHQTNNIIYSFYPGTIKFYASDTVFPTNKIYLRSDKTDPKYAVITINTNPYSTKVDIIN